MSFRAQFLEKYNADRWDEFHRVAREIQETTGYRFIREELLFKALAVRGSKLPSDEFERYEFLGDSVMEAIVALILYEKYSEFDPGKLTTVRSKLTDTDYISGLTEKLGLDQISKVLGIGSLNRKQAADLFEAFLCAMFLDKEKSFEHVKKWFEQNLDIDTIMETIESTPWGEKNSKSFLHEIIQSKYGNNVEVKYEHENLGTQNAPAWKSKVVITNKEDDTVLTEAEGSETNSKQREAEKLAAEALLLKWKEEGKI